MELVGGLNIPTGRSARFNATVPLAVLVIEPAQVLLATRGLRWPELRATPVEVRAAFPPRGRLLVSGIGLELIDGRLAYFWTLSSGRATALAELERCGFSVDRTPRRAEALRPRWAGGRTPRPADVMGLPFGLFQVVCLALVAGVVALALTLFSLLSER